MVTAIQLLLGTFLILQGLFLLFALAFNGGVGETFVNYSFFASALLMIVFGGLKIAEAKWPICVIFGLVSLVLYLPMIWQRFNFGFGTDTTGLYFDAWVIVILLVSLISKPNAGLNQTGENNATPG